MELKRIILEAYGRRRIVMGANGGWEIETFADGGRWVLDTDADLQELKFATDVLCIVRRARDVLDGVLEVGI